MTRYVTKTPPTGLAVTLQSLKDNLQIEHTEKDTYLTELLEAAIDYAETKLGWYMGSRVMEMYRDSIPDDNILHITRGPVAATGLSVEYIAFGETDYTGLPTTDYQTDFLDRSARILFTEVPSYNTERLSPIRVTYTAGYSDTDLIPKKVKRAVILIATEMYLNPENRIENFGMGKRISAADSLLHFDVNDHIDD